MAQAKIRCNPDKSLVEFVTPEGIEYGPQDYPDSDDDTDNLVFMTDDPNNQYVAVLEGGYEELKPNTLYKLVAVSTLVEEADIEEEDEEEDEDEDEPGDDVAEDGK